MTASCFQQVPADGNRHQSATERDEEFHDAPEPDQGNGAEAAGQDPNVEHSQYRPAEDTEDPMEVLGWVFRCSVK